MAPHNKRFPGYKLSSNLEGTTSTQPRERRTWPGLWYIISLLLGLLWLAPMVTLLIFHFRNQIIGASAWCPFSRCSFNPLDSSAIRIAKKMDVNDHNILGALQFVAKALEAWFVFVAASLLYNVTMILASTSNGLPIGFLATHLEFTDLRMVFNPFFWTTATPLNTTRSGNKPSTLKWYIFGSFAFLMCILVNLMGPASAVLVLPTLQWIDTPKQLESRFNLMNLSSPPTGDSVFSNCTGAMLAARNYSCNAEPYAASLDSLLYASVANNRQVIQAVSRDVGRHDRYAGNFNAVSQELGVNFMLNTTVMLEPFLWAPNRHVLRHLHEDLTAFRTAITTTQHQQPNLRPGDTASRNALQTVLKRRGPIVVAFFNAYSTRNMSVTTIAHDKQVRCVQNWELLFHPWLGSNGTYTKCIRIGQGWNLANTNVSFKVNDANSSRKAASVNAVFSDKSAYMNTTWNQEFISTGCLVNGSIPSNKQCDWDKFFSPSRLPFSLSNSSNNIVTLEFSTPNATKQPSMFIEFMVQQLLVNYTLDTSRSRNPLTVAQVDSTSLHNLSSPAIFNLDWLLAAWSVVPNGSLSQQRAAATVLVQSLEGFKLAASASDDIKLFAFMDLLHVGVLPFLQAMSMVTYETNSISPSALVKNLDLAVSYVTN